MEEARKERTVGGDGGDGGGVRGQKRVWAERDHVLGIRDRVS